VRLLCSVPRPASIVAFRFSERKPLHYGTIYITLEAGKSYTCISDVTQIVDACCIEQCRGSCEYLSLEVIPKVLHAHVTACQHGRIWKPKYASMHILRETLPLGSGLGAEHGADAMHFAALPESEYDAHREYIAIVYE